MSVTQKEADDYMESVITDTTAGADAEKRIAELEQALARCNEVLKTTSECWRLDQEKWESQRDRLLAQLKDIVETVGRVPQGAGLRYACIETLPNSTVIFQRNNQFITLGQIRKSEALIREIEGGPK